MRTAVVAGLRPSWLMLVLALAGAGAVAIGMAFSLRPTADTADAEAVAVTQAVALPSALSVAPLSGAQPPRFDVVRVAPSGNAVLAGRAEPGAQVTVHDGDREVGTTRADRHGYWLLLPPAPLAPGGLELTLSSRTEAGMAARGDGAVLLVVPERARPAEPALQALAVLVPDRAAPRVLQAQQEDAKRGDVKPGGRLGLDVLDYGEQGDIRLAGSAPPGAPLRVYVDDIAVGDAAADEQGRWSLVPGAAVPAGLRRLRVDQLSRQGRVSARVELPFQRAAPSPLDPSNDRVVVQPGQNLWRVARRVYGSGTRYTVIYRANRDQIRDPARIYPGQVFAVPAAAR